MKQYIIPKISVIPLNVQSLLVSGSDITKSGQNTPMGGGRHGDETKEGDIIYGDAKRNPWTDAGWDQLNNGWY